ncbi:MAG: D-isomer specific 2-hydroxyacid dehydrogenase family protein [Lachnospiraceae bacterium]|nr:D-isomer specific 2-hydroxyacid dehydrogenase family protein [Lachnospiraceae bacterium]
MKIYAFETRDDEEVYFNKMEKKYGVEIVRDIDPLDFERIDELEEGSLVTVLGMQHYGGLKMKALASRGITCLSTRTIGYNHIDLDAAKKYGVHVCNARYAPDGVADYTVMMLLLCLRCYKMALWRMQVNDFSLDGMLGREIHNLTVGVVGTGHIGSQVIRDLSGFGCRILCASRHQNPELLGLAEYVSLDEIYKECDVISFHLALTPETEHMINAESIGKMKDGVILINCARGGLMDMAALIDGIESEKIGALGLDTVENEEEIVHKDRKNDIFSDRDIAYLRQFKNVVYTQHMAFYTGEAVESMVTCGVEGVLAMHEGKEYPTQLC